MLSFTVRIVVCGLAFKSPKLKFGSWIESRTIKIIMVREVFRGLHFNLLNSGHFSLLCGIWLTDILRTIKIIMIGEVFQGLHFHFLNSGPFALPLWNLVDGQNHRTSKLSRSMKTFVVCTSTFSTLDTFYFSLESLLTNRITAHQNYYGP